MTQQKPQHGYRIQAEVTAIKGTCSWGHAVGQKMEISCHDTAGTCGMLFHEMFPTLSVLQFGGKYPWGEEGVAQVECPDRYNAVTLLLRRVSE